MGADEAEVDVHQKGDQRRQEIHVNREESLQRGRADNLSTLEARAAARANLRWRVHAGARTSAPGGEL